MRPGAKSPEAEGTEATGKAAEGEGEDGENKVAGEEGGDEEPKKERRRRVRVTALCQQCVRARPTSHPHRARITHTRLSLSHLYPALCVSLRVRETVYKSLQKQGASLQVRGRCVALLWMTEMPRLPVRLCVMCRFVSC